ncbi:MAG: hypothetical protein IBX58_18060 [Roseovarius sp.]|nr:hypothetical protein [Roseovarius sp.]
MRGEESWIDPIFGASLTQSFLQHWNFKLRGDVGGFGINSNVTWSVTAGFGYDFPLGKVNSSAFLGYRAIGTDYSSGGQSDRFTWDVIFHGPLIGLSFSF